MVRINSDAMCFHVGTVLTGWQQHNNATTTHTCYQGHAVSMSMCLEIFHSTRFGECWWCEIPSAGTGMDRPWSSDIVNPQSVMRNEWFKNPIPHVACHLGQLLTCLALEWICGGMSCYVSARGWWLLNDTDHGFVWRWWLDLVRFWNKLFRDIWRTGSSAVDRCGDGAGQEHVDVEWQQLFPIGCAKRFREDQRGKSITKQKCPDDTTAIPLVKSNCAISCRWLEFSSYQDLWNRNDDEELRAEYSSEWNDGGAADKNLHSSSWTWTLCCLMMIRVANVAVGASETHAHGARWDRAR